MAKKKNIQPEILERSIKGILNYATKTKRRKFTETIEIHFGLKNFDPARDKRIAGSTQLPHDARQRLKVLVLGNEKHIDEAKKLGLEFRSIEDLKRINRDKKTVKTMGIYIISYLFIYIYC